MTGISDHSTFKSSWFPKKLTEVQSPESLALTRFRVLKTEENASESDGEEERTLTPLLPLQAEQVLDPEAT